MSESKIAAPTQDVDELNAIAEAALKQRASAPVSYGSADARIPQKDILARLNKQQGGADVEGGMHRLFVPQTEVRSYAHMGYKKCKEGGKDVPFSTDIAMEIPTKIYRQELDANEAMDARRLRAVSRKMKADAEATGVGDEATVSLGRMKGDSKK